MAKIRTHIPPIVALLALGCSAPGPAINVAPEVQPSMYQISSQMLGLDHAMQISDPQARQQGVVATLDRIASITQELSTPKMRHSHKLMETEIDAFVAEVVKARDEAAGDPPNYYWAGRLHAVCIRCHDPEGGLWKK